MASDYNALTNAASDTPVQIIDGESYAILFENASPMRVYVTDEKTATKFQVENGETRSDHIVNLPIEITIEFILSGDQAKNQFENIKQSYRDNRLVTIQTKMDTYRNMLAVSVPHDETATMYAGAALPVRFQEWREIQPEYGELQQKQVAKKSQSSTVNRGKQTGKTPSDATKAKVEKNPGSAGFRGAQSLGVIK